MKMVRIRRVGDEVLLTLPRDWVQESGLADGDELSMRVADGELILSTSEQRHDQLMRYAREGMEEYREALAELAK